MIDRTPDEAEFLKHVADHQMTAAHDDGVHRHITFRRPDTINRYFNLTTWPGYLAISGDMGCYVFARLPDMFEFFRGDGINPGYWGEKLQAIERHGAYRAFSVPFFRDAAVSDFRSVYPPGTPDRMAIWEDFREEVLDGWNGDPQSVEDAVGRVQRYHDPEGKSRFDDFWDHNLEDYTYHFIWCCRAIRWGIQQYDAAKAERVAA